MAETVLFLDAKNGLVVTSERIVVGGEETPLQAISAIDLRRQHIGKTLLYTIYFIMAFIWLILLVGVGLGGLLSPKEDVLFFYMNALPHIIGAIIQLFIGLFPLLIGYIIWRKKQRGANVILESNHSKKRLRTAVELAALQQFVFHVNEEIEMLSAETPSTPKP